MRAELDNYARRLALQMALLGALFGSSARDELFSDDYPQDSPQATPRRDDGPRRVFKDRIAPHWFQNNTRFWYRNDLKDGAKEFILVDAERGKRETAFDHAKLTAALSKAAGIQYQAERLPR